MLAKRLSLAARPVLPRVVTKPTSIAKEPAEALARPARARPGAAAGGGSALNTGKGVVRKGRKQGRKARKALAEKMVGASGSGSNPTGSAGSTTSGAVDQLAQDVGVSGVPGGPPAACASTQRRLRSWPSTGSATGMSVTEQYESRRRR